MRRRWLFFLAPLVIAGAVLAATASGGPGLLDTDGDGVDDLGDNCPLIFNPGQENADGDALGDACDPTPNGPDGDGDGEPDTTDNCPAVSNPAQTDTDGDGQGDACDGTPTGDTDGDGVDNADYNCPTVPNASQTDSDGDGAGDACDSTPTGDTDGDGVDNADDNCPSTPNPGQEDTDNDSFGNVCDPTPNGPDADSDGVPDTTDNCLNTPNPGQENTDGDGLGNACDPFPNDPDDDADGDGVSGDTDNCPSVANAGQQDGDGDGRGDACDPDTAGPVVTPPANITVEANGPLGSPVSYGSATATDDFDGPLLAVCSPASGSTFRLGETTVTCTATDSAGNTGSASFKITVADRSAPALFLPEDLWIQTTETSVPKTDPRITAFLNDVSAEDLVDGNPFISNNAPATFNAGVTVVTFTVIDHSGNDTSGTAKVTISPDPPPASNQDRQPPDNVSNVKAKVGNQSVTINWQNPPDEDFDRVVVTRQPGTNGGEATMVYSGTAGKLVDRGLAIGTQYRYLLVAYDKADNHRAGVALVVVGRRQLLFGPADGATVSRPPTLRWAKVGGARYYNVQLWYTPGRGAAAEAALKKVFTAWPSANKLKLKKKWKYSGKRYRLKPGTYRWYVWPGIGPRANNTYGDLLGQSNFVVKKRK